MKRSYLKEVQLRQETEKMLDEIQNEAISQNKRYSDEMNIVRSKIEQYKRNEHDVNQRCNKMEAEKNQLITVINTLQAD